MTENSDELVELIDEDYVPPVNEDMPEPYTEVTCQHCGEPYPYKDIENPERHPCALDFIEEIEARRNLLRGGDV